MSPKCKCGKVIGFRKGQVKVQCPTKNCGMHWELKPEGYWAIGLFTTIFNPIFERAKACSVKTRADRYKNYQKSRKRKGR